jgi:hypothetical protein
MNEFSMEDDTVLLCRVKTTEGDFKADCYPTSTEHIAISLHTRNGSSLHESFGGYQRNVVYEEKPDRSQGDPYQWDRVSWKAK